MSALSNEERVAVRNILIDAMSLWSEENYCAGWLNGLEHMLHRQAGMWETLGRLVGWPIDCDASGGWESWEEAGERYATPDYQVEHYGRVV